MDKSLKAFMERTFPVETKIKIDRAADEKIVGKTFIVEHMSDEGLLCTDESGKPKLINPDEATFYKLNQPPILAYSIDEQPEEFTDVRQIAEFIVKNGMNCDITMYKKDTNAFVLSTMGIFIDHIADMDFRSELLTILVPLQQQYPLGMPREVINEKAMFDYNGAQVYFEIGDYEAEPTTMAITLFTDDGEEYGTLTVNLGEHEEIEANQAFIDVNNMPEAIELLSSIEGVKPVIRNGVTVTARSGFCEYPLYEFDEELLRQLDNEGYERHLVNYSDSQQVEHGNMEMGGIS